MGGYQDTGDADVSCDRLGATLGTREERANRKLSTVDSEVEALALRVSEKERLLQEAGELLIETL